MAEGSSTAATASSTSTVEESERELCAVCLEPYVHPAKLPCGHVFCFLCIKGTANRSKRCAMCRQEIPHDFIEKPTLVDKVEDNSLEYNYQWYYEGRNGWWQYDERTSKELETAYKNGERSCELLVAGFLYVMDLEAMLQLRRNDPSRRRRIKRDMANIDKIGIAGLRCPNLNKLNAMTNCSGSSNFGNASVMTSTSTAQVEVEAPARTVDLIESDFDDAATDADSQRTIEYDSPFNLTFASENFPDFDDE